jgi:hypothetical protein
MVLPDGRVVYIFMDGRNKDASTNYSSNEAKIKQFTKLLVGAENIMQVAEKQDASSDIN